jgi:hypothetical protein
MTVSRGKLHIYLGMTLDYTLDYTTLGQVKITMFDFLDEITITFGKADPTGSGKKTSAAPVIFFQGRRRL